MERISEQIAVDKVFEVFRPADICLGSVVQELDVALPKFGFEENIGASLVGFL